MSQTSPNPADHTATNGRGTNERVNKPLLISGDVIDYTNKSDTDLQPDLISPPQQVDHQALPRHWWQRLSFRNKAAALAIAVLTVSVLALGTIAYHANKSNTSQSTQAKQSSTNRPADIAVVPQDQLSLTLVIETAVAALLLVGLIAAYLANRAIRPIQTAALTTEKSLKEEIESADIALARLSAQSRFALDQASLSQQQDDIAEQAQLLSDITYRLRQSLYFEDLLKTTVKEVRRAIKTDRVIIFGFDPTNWDGNVLAESVAPGLPQLLRVKINDPCFRERHVELYKNGQVTTINDIYQEPRVTDCYRKMLEQFAVKANLVAPILNNNELLGLMIAHQCSEPRIWQKSEVDLFAQLATQVGLAVDQVSFLEQQEAEAERVQLLTEITLRIRQSLYLEDLLKTTVKEVRRAIKTDRVLIFGLDPTHWDGLIVAESVAPGWPQTLKVKIDDPCLRSSYVEMYKNGRVRAINNIYQEPGLTSCYIKSLEQFAVKAQLVAPILNNNELLGLMIAHQCSEPRTWQKPEVDLFAQLATQVGFAVDQVSFLQ